MSDQAEDYDSQYSDSSSSSESTLHDLLNRPVETRAQANARQNSAFNNNATASMNSLKTSAGAFTTPPVPPGTVPITTDDDPYSSDLPVPPRNNSPLPNPKEIPRMTVDDMALLFERLLRGQNLQTPPPASKLHDTTPSAVVRQVPPSEYLQTTTAQSKSFSDLKFSNNVSTNRDTLKCVKILLAECSLLSLVDSSRRKPIYSEDNVFGYTPDSVRNNYSVITLVPKDDLFKYAHDCKRLFSIMYLITSKDLHYLINQALIDRDGVAWYKAIVEHVHGTTNTDIRKAKYALESLKVYDSKTVKENISLLQEAFLNLNNAQPIPLTQDEMTYYLQEKFCLDGRISVQSVMATSKACKVSYNDTIKALVELDPPVVTRHKMAALVGEKEICRNNLAGRCNLGDKCTRSHEVPKGKGPSPTPPGTKTPYPKSDKFKKSDEKHPRAKMPFPITVTREHRAAVGPPRGRQTTDNPLGWSKAQMNVLQHAQETAPQDAWASGNAAYFSAQESPQHRAHFNMLKTSSSSQALTHSSQALTYTTSNRNAERYREFREPTLRHFLRIPDHPARKQEDIEIKQHIDEYYSAYPHYASSNLPQPHHNLLVYIHLHSNSDHYPGHAPLQPRFSDEGALFCALGWYVTRNETLRQFGKARNDVKIGTPQLVDLIYTLGGLYYHADMIKPLAGTRHTRFDPTGMEYNHAGHPGCYSSNMTGIPDYVLVFKHLDEAFDDEYVKDLLLLTMYYDFMSYLALTYAQSIRVGLALLQARTTVVTQLQNLLHLTDLADYHSIIRTMVIIAKQMLPAPPPPPVTPAVQQPRVSRFSCAVMSAPPDGYMPPSSSDTSENEENEEDEEEEELSSDHSVPEYEEEAYSTHSTPQGSFTTAQLDSEYIPRRLTHPARRPAQAPSPMRRASLPGRSSPVAKRTSPQSIRKKLRSPQTGTRKRKQRSPQQIVSAAFAIDPESPPQQDKMSRSSRSPPDTTQIKDPVEYDEALNLLQVNGAHHKLNTISRKTQVIVIDSGASMSGTGDRALLSNIRPTTLIVSSAFGDSAQPTEMGDLQPHMIPTVLIDAMKDTTLLSVSQMCGQKVPLCGIFSPVDCRFFPFHQMLPYLKLVSENCDEVLRGKVENGLYVMESN